jgi:hypothetical protein
MKNGGNLSSEADKICAEYSDPLLQKAREIKEQR